MELLAEQPTLEPLAIFERAFFQCSNCGGVSDCFAALPRD